MTGQWESGHANQSTDAKSRVMTQIYMYIYIYICILLFVGWSFQIISYITLALAKAR